MADARALALEKLRLISEHIDPQEVDIRKEAPPEEEGTTFAALADEYLERHAKKKKSSWRDDERRIRTELLKVWADRQAGSITRREVILLLDRVADRPAPIAANRLRALISKIFNFGIARDLVDHNPVTLVPRPGTERVGQRALSDAEIQTLWRTLDASDNVLMAAILKLRIITGQRTTEVSRMRWDDLSSDIWELPESTTKNRKPHAFPITPLQLQVLEQVRPITGDSPWVFASPRKDNAPLSQIRRFVVEAAAESGVRFYPRDLRRTVTTGMTRIGIAQLTVSKLLNHTIPTVTDKHYDRYNYYTEKRDAALAWDAHLSRLINKPFCVTMPAAGAPEGAERCPSAAR